MFPVSSPAMDVREKLLRAALHVFEESGSRGATTRRIAAEAGVNEITLFRHFGSKAALLTEALRLASEDRQAAFRLPDEPVDPAGELMEWCRHGMDNLRRKRAMIRACMGEMAEEPGMAQCAGAAPRAVAEELETYLLRLSARGLADPGLDQHAAAAMLMGALFTDVMGRDMMPERYAYSEAEAPERYVRVFLRAIGAAPPALRPVRATA
jgi:AcrR family transcriptional regulator